MWRHLKFIQKYLEIDRSISKTYKYLKVPRIISKVFWSSSKYIPKSNNKYLEIPQITKKYLEIFQSTSKCPYEFVLNVKNGLKIWRSRGVDARSKKIPRTAASSIDAKWDGPLFRWLLVHLLFVSAFLNIFYETETESKITKYQLK